VNISFRLILHIDKFLTYSNKGIYIGNHNTIKYVSLTLNKDSSDPIEVSQEDILQINLQNENDSKENPCRLLGLLCHKFVDRNGKLLHDPSIITCIESVQSIVDYSFLNIKAVSSANSESPSRFSYELC